ncbi:MAG TPA: VWA domain-containing protein [Pyrinomonadaceae bacterium]
MSTLRIAFKLVVIIAISAAIWQCYAQEPPVSPAPAPAAAESPTKTSEPQESIRVFTEEVVIPVFVFDSNGRFDPTLEADEMIVFEDDVRQTVKSIRPIPPNVLLLLDTAGALNPAMKTTTTRDVATRLVVNLKEGSQVAAIQFGGGVELIQGWTADTNKTIHALKNRLSSGSRSYLVDALKAAATQLKEVPAGSRHVVLITDGVDYSGDETKLNEAIKGLLNVHATIHVISYTALGRKSIGKHYPLVKITNTKRRSAQDIADEILNPISTSDARKWRNIYVIVDTDIAMRRRHNAYEEATKESELWLKALAAETGGDFFLPGSADEMIRQGELLAGEIGIQYVVTYRPKRPLSLATEEEYRSIKVATTRTGLQIHAAKGYVAKSP